MKLNHFFVAALALGLTHSFVLAGEGENHILPHTATPSTTKVTTKSTAGTTRVSTRGTVSTAAVTSTARPTATRTASVSRVNLRRPTATVTSTTPTAPVGGGQSNGL